MSKEMMEADDKEGAFRNMLAAGVSFVALPPALLANMTNIIIDEMKVAGYSFINSFQDCEDLLAGICQSTTNQKLEKTIDDIVYKYKPVTSKDFRDMIGPSLQTNARDCVTKGFGAATDKVDHELEMDLYDRCLADLYVKWKKKRLEIMGQVAEANVQFVNLLQQQIIMLEAKPDPVILIKEDGEIKETTTTITANVRIDEKQAETLFKQMFDKVKILGGKKGVTSVEARIQYIWTLDGKVIKEDNSYYMGMGKLFDSDKLTIDIPIKEEGSYKVDLKIIVKTEYISLIVSSDPQYVPKGFEKFFGDVYSGVSNAVSRITGYGKPTQAPDPNAKYYGDDVVTQGKDLFNLEQTVETATSLKFTAKVAEEEIKGAVQIEGPDEFTRGEEGKLLAKLSPELKARNDLYINWYINEIKSEADFTGEEIIVYAPADKNTAKYIVQVSTESKGTLSGVSTALTEALGGKKDTKPAKNPVVAEASKTVKFVDKSFKSDIEEAYKNKNWKKLLELINKAENEDEKKLIKSYLKKLADEMHQTNIKYYNAMIAHQKAESTAYDKFYAKAEADRKRYITNKDSSAEDDIVRCMNDAYNKQKRELENIESDINYLKKLVDDYESYNEDNPGEYYFDESSKILIALYYDPSKPLKITDYNLICTDKKAADDTKKAKVTIKTTKTNVKPGETVPVVARIDYPHNAIMCPVETEYIWQGNHAGDGSTVDFMATKTGSYTLSVVVKCMDGTIGSASKDFRVTGGGITGKVKGLDKNQVYFGTKKIIQFDSNELSKYLPPSNVSSDSPFAERDVTDLKSVSNRDGAVRVEVPTEDILEDGIIIEWHSTPNVIFDPIEGVSTTVHFNETGNIKIYANVIKVEKGFRSTVGESDLVEIEVISPEFELRFDPTQDKAKIGEEVKVKVIARPSVDDKYIDYRWVEPTSRKEYDNGEIGFTPKDGKTVNFHVMARVPISGNSIEDNIKDQYTPGEYIVTAELLGPKYDKTSQQWSAANKGLVTTQKQLVTGMQIELKATTKGIEPDKVNYKWSSNEGCHIDSVDISDYLTVSRSEPGTCNITVTAYDKDKRKLGSDQISFSISDQEGGSVKDNKGDTKDQKDQQDQQDQKDKEQKQKEAQQAIKKAEELASQGKYEEAAQQAAKAEALDPETKILKTKRKLLKSKKKRNKQ